jgi:hypothetical protein
VRKILYVLLFIICLFSFSCGGSKYSEADAWKEKYDIKPNTGMLIGNITLESIWKDKKIIFFLIEPKYDGKLIAYDTINDNGTFEIKNLQKGKYFLSADERIYLLKENVPLPNIGIAPLRAGQGKCRTFTIDIKEDSITYIEYESPGSFLTTDAVIPGGVSNPKYNCALDQSWIELNELNYTKILNRGPK